MFTVLLLIMAASLMHDEPHAPKSTAISGVGQFIWAQLYTVVNTMSQRKRKRPATHPRPRSTQASITPKATTIKASLPVTNVPAQPAPDDTRGWGAHWEKRGQPWRTEPEITAARQVKLATYYATSTDIHRGIYPFGGVKLSRADVEWLLATYGSSFTPENRLNVRGADLDGTDLSNLPLSGLSGGPDILELLGAYYRKRHKTTVVQMNNALLYDARLEGAYLVEANLQGADLSGAHLEGADLSGAHLEGANLHWAKLQGTDLSGAHLEKADLSDAYLKGTDLNRAQLQGANLDKAILADQQGVGPQLADVQWDGINLSVIEWSQVKMLGNEYLARQKKDQDNNAKGKQHRLEEYQKAVRANRQLAVALQEQGLNEDATRFAYRANLLQREVLWFQMIQAKISFKQRIQKLGAWLFSHLLDLLAGYGYKPGRSFLAYLLVVFGFMGLYLLTSHFTTPHLAWDEAMVLSLSSFHGRGFFPSTITLGDPYARLAVAEALLGLFVEVSLIATFTQRFLGK